MSYSFSVSGANKEEVKQRIEEQFDNIVQQQSAHEADRDAAQEAAFALVDVAADPNNGQQMNVTIYGSLSQQNPDDQSKRRTTSVSLNVSVAVA